MKQFYAIQDSYFNLMGVYTAAGTAIAALRFHQETMITDEFAKQMLDAIRNYDSATTPDEKYRIIAVTQNTWLS